MYVCMYVCTHTHIFAHTYTYHDRSIPVYISSYTGHLTDSICSQSTQAYIYTSLQYTCHTYLCTTHTHTHTHTHYLGIPFMHKLLKHTYIYHYSTHVYITSHTHTHRGYLAASDDQIATVFSFEGFHYIWSEFVRNSLVFFSPTSVIHMMYVCMYVYIYTYICTDFVCPCTVHAYTCIFMHSISVCTLCVTSLCKHYAHIQAQYTYTCIHAQYVYASTVCAYARTVRVYSFPKAGKIRDDMHLIVPTNTL
jgi:hypothetical protein